MHAAVMTKVVLFECFFGAIVLRIGKRVPAPVAHRAQGNAALVVFGEGLQAGGIDGKGESAVAYGERRQAVEALDDGIVAADHGVAVNLTLRKECKQRAEET